MTVIPLFRMDQAARLNIKQAEPEQFAHTYHFDELFVIRREGKVAMPVSGSCVIAYDHEGGWHVETIALDAWASSRTPTKAPPIVLREHTAGGQKCPFYKTVHDALMISEMEAITEQVRECIREDGGSLEAAE